MFLRTRSIKQEYKNHLHLWADICKWVVDILFSKRILWYSWKVKRINHCISQSDQKHLETFWMFNKILCKNNSTAKINIIFFLIQSNFWLFYIFCVLINMCVTNPNIHFNVLLVLKIYSDVWEVFHNTFYFLLLWWYFKSNSNFHFNKIYSIYCQCALFYFLMLEWNDLWEFGSIKQIICDQFECTRITNEVCL